MVNPYCNTCKSWISSVFGFLGLWQRNEEKWGGGEGRGKGSLALWLPQCWPTEAICFCSGSSGDQTDRSWMWDPGWFKPWLYLVWLKKPPEDSKKQRLWRNRLGYEEAFSLLYYCPLYFSLERIAFCPQCICFAENWLAGIFHLLGILYYQLYYPQAVFFSTWNNLEEY